MAKSGMHMVISGDASDMEKAVARATKAADKLEAKYKEVGRAAKKTNKAQKSAFGPAAASSLLKYGAGLVTISGTIGLIGRGYQTWLKNAKELATASQAASKEVIALAALQEGGDVAKRVRAFIQLGAQYGIGIGEAASTGQALQTQFGFKGGLAAAETVFRATLVDVPIAAGREAEILGAGQGARPGEQIRRL